MIVVGSMLNDHGPGERVVVVVVVWNNYRPHVMDKWKYVKTSDLILFNCTETIFLSVFRTSAAFRIYFIALLLSTASTTVRCVMLTTDEQKQQQQGEADTCSQTDLSSASGYFEYSTFQQIIHSKISSFQSLRNNSHTVSKFRDLIDIKFQVNFSLLFFLSESKLLSCKRHYRSLLQKVNNELARVSRRKHMSPISASIPNRESTFFLNHLEAIRLAQKDELANRMINKTFDDENLRKRRRPFVPKVNKLY